MHSLGLLPDGLVLSPGDDPQVLSSLLDASASAYWAKKPGIPRVPKTYTPSGPAPALTTASAQWT